ncbi:MAG: acyltransferase [Prevotella sp.]|nr:acyltransferase [Prevotella sp.]
MEKPRIDWIDLAKGICILLVMWWHVKELYSNRGFTDRSYVLYTANYFRMPLYFFLSGLFFKTYGGYVDFLIRKTNKLFVPFIVFAVLAVAYTLIWPDKLPALRTWQSFYPFVTIWFLWCLFLMNNLFYLVLHLSENNLPTLYVSIVLLGLFGFWSGRDYIEALHLRTALTALPYFVLGYAVRRHTAFLSARGKWWEWLTGAASFVILYYMTLRFGKAGIFYVHNEYHIPVWALYGGGILGIYGILVISRLLRRVPVVSYLGRYSIVVLITHYPLIYLFPKHWSRILFWGFGGWCAAEELLLLVCVEVPIIALCTHYLPWLFAQKDLIPLRRKE